MITLNNPNNGTQDTGFVLFLNYQSDSHHKIKYRGPGKHHLKMFAILLWHYQEFRKNVL
jgi:hypothetical protein